MGFGCIGRSSHTCGVRPPRPALPESTHNRDGFRVA